MGTGEMGILGNETGSGEEGFSTNKTENKIGYGWGGGGPGFLGNEVGSREGDSLKTGNKVPYRDWGGGTKWW